MTFGRVPAKFNSLESNDVRISKIPSSIDWKALAQNVHWLEGLGTQLVPFNYPSGTEMSWINKAYAEFYIRPKTQGLDRIWVLRCKTNSAGDLTFQFGNSDAVTVRATTAESVAFVRETNFTPSSLPTVVVLTCSSPATVSGTITSYGCFELPRVLLTSGSDGGIDDSSLQVRSRIEGSGSREGVRAVASRLSSSINIARTAGIFDWTCKLRNSGSSVYHSSSFFNAVASPGATHFSTFSASVRVRRNVLHSEVPFTSSLTGTADYAFLMRGTDALCSGAVALQSAAGVTVFTGAVGNGFAWFTGTFAMLRDDSSSANYMRPPGRTSSDFLGITLRGLGAGTVHVHSISIGEKGGYEAPEGWIIDFADGTFSRASEASYLTSGPTDGTTSFISWASSNVLRYETRGDSSLALFEGARSNVLLRNQELDNASWLTVGSVPVATNQPGTDGNNADRISGSSGLNVRYQNITYTSSTYAFSAWGSGSQQHFFIVYDGTNVWDGPSATLSGTYQRFSNRVATVAGAGTFEALDGRTVGSFLAGNRDATLDLIQIELGRYPTSAIRTTSTTGSRSPDVLTFNWGSYDSGLLTGKGEFSNVSPVFDASDLLSGDIRWLLTISGTQDGIRIRHDGTNVKFEAVAGGTVKAASLSQSFAKHTLIGPVSWDPAGGLVYVSGVVGAAGTSWTWPSGYGLRIGGIYNSGTNEADCRLGNMRSW